MLGLRPGTQGEMALNQSQVTTSRYNPLCFLNCPIHLILLWDVLLRIAPHIFVLWPTLSPLLYLLVNLKKVPGCVDLCTNKPQGRGEPSTWYCCTRVWFSSAQVMGKPRWGNYSCIHFSSHTIMYFRWDSAMSFPSYCQQELEYAAPLSSCK